MIDNGLQSRRGHWGKDMVPFVHLVSLAQGFRAGGYGPSGRGSSPLRDTMRIIITGGRNFNNIELVKKVFSDLPSGPHTIVHGGCSGADSLADKEARRRGWCVEVYPAKWNIHGKSAGPKRNAEMADMGADLCIAFPGGRGTTNMVNNAKRRGIKVISPL